MAVKDVNVLPTANFAKECITFVIPATSVGQTDLEVDSCVPGFAFEIERISVMATAVTATASVNVKIGTTSALSSVITPVAGTDTAGTLSSTLASIRGSDSDAINVEYTTNGSGVITNGRVRVWIRPIPLNGEILVT